MANATVKAGLVAVSLVWALAAQSVLAGEGASYVKGGSKAAGPVSYTHLTLPTTILV